jgi:hypothetical protein
MCGATRLLLTCVRRGAGVEPGQAKNEVQEGAFAFAPGTTASPWRGIYPSAANAPNTSVPCTDCASLNLTFTWNVTGCPPLTQSALSSNCIQCGSHSARTPSAWRARALFSVRCYGA